MRYVIGIDEVGRGSLAGPVTVAAVRMPSNTRFRDKKFGQLRDSKKLSPKQRELWFGYFSDHPQIEYAVTRVYPRKIEKLNISKAANLAAFRAFKRLTTSCLLPPNRFRVFLDGGLYLGRKGLIPEARTVPKGDEKIHVIKIASIVAKVNRDRLMTRLGKKYPKYGFEIHKGYGTRMHLKAIRKYGPSEAHRLTFLRKYHKMI